MARHSFVHCLNIDAHRPAVMPCQQSQPRRMTDGAKGLGKPLATQQQLRYFVALVADVLGIFRATQLLGQTVAQGRTGLQSRLLSVMTQALHQTQLRGTQQRPALHNAVLNLHQLMPP